MTQTVVPTSTGTWNEVAFTGNLGKDPEMAFTPNGTAVTKFSIAVNQGKDKPTMWLNVECWKALAEQCNMKLAKGARVEVKGRLVQDVWKDKVGEIQRRYKVTAQAVRLLKRSDGKDASGFIEDVDDDNDSLGDLENHPF